MRGVSRALRQELLKHRNEVAKLHPVGRTFSDAPSNLKKYTITYSDLCARAAAAEFTHSVGTFLGEIADWCRDEGYPPLNALAVNASTGVPGEGFDGAGGFALNEWPSELEACVRFKRYPKAPPD